MKNICLMLAMAFSLNCHFSLEAQEDPGISEVLTYWFGDLKTPEDYPEDKEKIWFSGGAAVDQEIRDRFESVVVSAGKNQLDEWKKTPRGRLALLILLDQFPRNIYRGKPKAFSFDYKAEQLTLGGLDAHQDLELLPVERVFFYLPLEHAENLELQQLSVDKFNQLVKDAPESLKTDFQKNAEYAQRHYDIIKKFGRFPHRNAILGRESTAEEIEFLKGPNSSF